MRKAVSLKVVFWVEGEDDPAHNFVETAKKAIADMVEKGAFIHPELKITVKSLREQSGSADTEKDEGDEF